MSMSCEIDSITNDLNYVYIDNADSNESNEMLVNSNQELIAYIVDQKIDQNIKEIIISLIENDNYNSYCDIYNICMDNNLELPPLL